jgi:NitT/TauT family transport system permease protein
MKIHFPARFKVNIGNVLLSILSKEKNKPNSKTRFFEYRIELPKRKSRLFSTIPFIILIGAWLLLSYGNYLDSTFLPTPVKVANDLSTLLFSDHIFEDIWASFFRIMQGFLLAAVLAIPIGLLMGSFATVNAIVSPFSAFVRYMPATAFISLLIIWFGIGEVPKILLVFLGIFFFLLQMITDAVSNVPREYLETAFTLGANRRQTLTRVIWRSALPGIMDSLKTMVGAAWTYLVVAELIASEKGLGHMIELNQRILNTSRIFSAIILIGIIGLTTNIVFELIIAWLFPWRRFETRAG